MGKIINVFGGPGTGKSVTAAQLFAEMKKQQMNCELVTEFAKELVYDESYRVMENQIWIFANQHQRMHRLKDKVDFIITDAPLFNSIVYSGKGEENKEFHQFVLREFNKYDNLNIYLERETTYRQEGRYQDENGAKEIDNEVLRCFDYFDINYVKVGLKNVVPTIISLL
jgi:nicotinamide riboside kinase